MLASLELDADDRHFEVQFIHAAPAPPPDNTMPVAVIWECAANSPAGRQYRAASPRNPIRQLYQGNEGPAHDPEPARPEEAAGPGPNDNNRDSDDELWQVGSADESDEAPDPDLLQVNFIVLRLECSPVDVQIPLRIPAGVQDTLDALYLTLGNDVCAAYSHLLAVRPQLQPERGAVLALPPWACREGIVILDLRGYDGRFFATALPELATPEVICRIAHVPSDGTLAVFPYGVEEPLAGDEAVEPRTGGSILILPAGQRPPPRETLASMLRSRRGWNADVALPRSPGGPRSSYLCVVLDCGHRLGGNICQASLRLSGTSLIW